MTNHITPFVLSSHSFVPIAQSVFSGCGISAFRFLFRLVLYIYLSPSSRGLYCIVFYLFIHPHPRPAARLRIEALSIASPRRISPFPELVVHCPRLDDKRDVCEDSAVPIFKDPGSPSKADLVIAQCCRAWHRRRFTNPLAFFDGKQHERRWHWQSEKNWTGQ